MRMLPEPGLAASVAPLATVIAVSPRKALDVLSVILPPLMAKGSLP